ncbi:MAG: aminotransferase class I/II-fold pyridoxal phosphate-dependent enzyme [Bacillota bacterium]|nr:aminotransferase class I/II-fold pyridoxal phosphate-dependent enzyme [Bacillota bacterium]
MIKLTAKDKEKLEIIYKKALDQYDDYKALNLKLNMARGKPSPEQLDISTDLITALNKADIDSCSSDYRNYGMIDGIPEAKELFAPMLEVSTKEIIIGGNSSLNMMYDIIIKALIKGVPGVNIPWISSGKVKFLCPSPGYDRHFAICENLGIEMIPIEMTQFGPDMDTVERLTANDESIKGIWCVPKYSNPEGITYSDEVVDRLASMKTKAEDFRIFWDNAYAVHHLSDKKDDLKNVLKACKEAGNPDRVFIFASTSKITFPGAGIAMLASSEDNINGIKKLMSVQTIGPDKLNELRHVKYFNSYENILLHMKKHASILKPKFDLVINILQEQLGDMEIAWWSKPNGGYFISLNTLDGCAKEVVKKAEEAGLTLTNAGATFPYGKDPKDKNIRIAPSYPSLNELKKAIELLCICVKIVCLKKKLEE